MRVAFFISSVGDTNLALSTIRSMEHKGPYEMLLIALTQTAEQCINHFQHPSVILKSTISEILATESSSEGYCTEDQLAMIVQYIQNKNINYAYFGVPSVNNAIPFQIAEALEDTPILMAYEFMFHPASHCLWEYVPKLKNKPHVQWALPLVDAIHDFKLNDASQVHITSHLSIDHAYLSDSTRNAEEIRERLEVPTNSALAFVSSTTQPVNTDVTFLECLLTELPHHPDVQVRFGLHPGIQDLDSYIQAVLAVYERYPNTHKQFKIILSDSLSARFKTPELSIQHPSLQYAFLKTNINGADAAFAADRVAQAVPGALLNQSVIEGKPSYAHSGKSYLPKHYFSSNLAAFFSETRKTLREKTDLGLNEKSAPENYADIISSYHLP